MSALMAHVEALPDTPVNRQMLRGHELRKGHTPDMRHVSADGVLWHRVALCCGETVPERVDTWESATPWATVGPMAAAMGGMS